MVKTTYNISSAFRVGMVKTTYNISSVELLTDIHRHIINNK